MGHRSVLLMTPPSRITAPPPPLRAGESRRRRRHERLRLRQEWRHAGRGRGARDHRTAGRHAVLLLLGGGPARRLAGIRRRHEGHERLGLLRAQGQLQPRGRQAVRRPRRRGRHRLGRRDAPRAGGRHSGQEDHLFRRRQEAVGADGRARGRHRPDQRRELGRAGDAEFGRGPARREGRHHDPGESRHRRRHAREDHDRAQGEQVRHRHRPRARCLRPGRPPAQPQGRGRGDAYRLAAHDARPVPRCDRQGARADRPAARRRPPDRPLRHRRRPGDRLCRREAALDRRLPAGRAQGDRRAGLRADLRARPPAGRRGGCAGGRGDPRQTRCFQDFRHRRRGDERPDPADPVRRLARYPAGPSAAPECGHDPLRHCRPDLRVGRLPGTEP